MLLISNTTEHPEKESFLQKPRKEGPRRACQDQPLNAAGIQRKPAPFIITGRELLLPWQQDTEMNPVNGVKSCKISRFSAPGHSGALTST